MIARRLGRVAYEPTWRAMQAFNLARQPDSPDQLWMVEHPPVFTLGLAGRREHVLAPGDIPVVATDRGGQVTYHGPGQAVGYVLLDLRRAGFGVKELVRRLEQAVIEVLDGYGVAGERQVGMPGVYVGGANGRVLRSEDGGWSFSDASNGLPTEKTAVKHVTKVQHDDSWVNTADVYTDLTGGTDRVVELHAAAGEELDAVVGHRVVGGGEHDAEVGAERTGEVGDAGRGDLAEEQDVDAGGGESGHDGRLEELPGNARVPAHHGQRAVPTELAAVGQDVGRGHGQPPRRLGGRDARPAERQEHRVHVSEGRCRPGGQ